MSRKSRTRKTRKLLRPKTLIILALSFSILFGFLWYSNNIAYITKISYKANIPDKFDGFKIIHLSDAHIGNNDYLYNSVIKKVSDAKPDIIVITGDFVDHDKYNEEKMLDVARRLSDIADVYFVSGNHEGSLIYSHPTLLEKLISAGFTLLDNNFLYINKNNEKIAIAGTIDDSLYPADNLDEEKRKGIETTTKNLPNDIFTIYLAHRPENIEMYPNRKNTLVLSGHAHGGQIRLPWVGGIFSPGQGFFPKYHSGLYTVNNTDMYVNRGLGNSSAPYRLFNQPEIVLITLTK